MRRTIAFLSKLQASDRLQCLPPATAVRLTKAVLPKPPLNKPLLLILTPLIIKRLRDFSTSTGTNSVILRPPSAFRVGCSLACKLLDLDQRQLALDVFQALLDTGCIPPEAIRNVDTSSQDFEFPIRSVIVRSCLHWDWRLQVKRLLVDAIKTATQPDKSLVDLVLDAVYALLEAPPSAIDIVYCSVLMREMLRWTDVAIPHSLFHQFYESAMHTNCGKEAEILFANTRLPSVLEKCRYPIPQGHALTWFMRHLTVDSRNTHLGRVLVTEVVENNEAIPVQDRAEFISLTASHGYGVLARALWERYADDRDGKVIVGNAGTMVRMASLFANLIKKTSANLRQSSGMGARLASSRDPDLSLDARQRKLVDLTAFAQRVIVQFCRALPHLQHATHFELTSLARAYFLFGMVKEGFNTLKVLLNRKEVPDLYDVNVALSVIAKHDLQGATLIIERMVDKGLRPDPVTFGTILHQATLRGEENVVKTLIRRAGRLGHARLTQKSVSSLIQNSLKPNDESRASTQRKLARAMRLVRTMMVTDPRFVCTPNTGKACVLASLQVDDPMMAFQFWKLLVKGRTDWRDGEMRSLRQKIGDGISRHWEDGKVRQDEGEMALSQLGRKEGCGVPGKQGSVIIRPFATVT